MNEENTTHSAGPTVPPDIQPGERVTLNGPHAHVCTGLYVFKAYRNGTSFATVTLWRGFPDLADFELHPSIKGDIEIRGHYHDCASGAETQHSFGFTHAH